MAHPNEDVVRKGIVLPSPAATWHALATFLAPDLLYHALGQHPLSGTIVESTRASNSSTASPK